IGDRGQGYSRIDIEDAAPGRRNLRDLAQGPIRPLAKKVIAGSRIGQGTPGIRDKELDVEDALATVGGAEEDFHLRVHQLEVGGVVPGSRGVPASGPAFLLQKRHEQDKAAESAQLEVVVGPRNDARRESAARVVVVVQGHANLLEVVAAGDLLGRLASLLDG